MQSAIQLKENRAKYFIPTAVTYYKEPLQLVKARGTKVWDAQGNEYLDAIGGIVCISAGHNHPKIKAAWKKMIDEDTIQHVSYLYLSQYNQALAEKVIARAPKSLDKCYFTNSGSEANELAIMAARQFTGEQTVLHLRLSYHGGTAVPLSLCGHHTWRFSHQPVVSAVTVPAPYCYRCPLGLEPKTCATACAKDIEQIILSATSGKIAALIVEPILGVGGFVDGPKEYFKIAYETCKKYGGLYISDEVQTGIGRCGETFFEIENLGVTPDIITMAKGLGNGAPIGGVVMKSEIAQSLAGKVHVNTFGGDPYPTMQAGMTLDIIAEEKLMQNAKEVGGLLKEGFIALKHKHDKLGDVRGRGLLLGLELVKNKETKAFATEETAQFLELAKDRGLLVGKGGLYGNVVRIAPPLSFSKQEAARVLSITNEILSLI
jgi:4-aminobutyrate aminotransferase-like enzyme